MLGARLSGRTDDVGILVALPTVFGSAVGSSDASEEGPWVVEA